VFSSTQTEIPFELQLMQESVALQSIVEGSASDKIACDDFVGQCSRVVVQLEEEEYIFQYIQAHT
jgi:hypothetical protein